jgi:single-strand DNA-binding protein
MSVNKVILVGRLGQAPEIKYTPGGAPVATLSVATSENWQDKNGQKQERTEWHRVIVWGKLAEICNQYLAKGRQVFVEGRIQTRSWDDKATGAKKYATEIIATTVQFLGGTTGATASDRNSAQDGAHESAGAIPAGMMSPDYNNISTDASFTADDIPF